MKRRCACFNITQINVHRETGQPVIDAGLADFVAAPCEPIPGIALIPTPGHTPGHVSVRIESEGQKALITGDSFHHPCQIARSDWATVADSNREESSATRAKILEELVDMPILMLGTHFAAPTAGYIVRDGASYRLAIEL